MLQMPRIPQPKGFHFENVEAHQLRQALATEIRETIEVLTKSTYVPGYVDGLRKYIAAVEPGAVRDFARLPYPSSGPRDLRGRTKIAAVYAKLSYLIQLFWDQVLDGTNNTASIRRYLMDLKLIAGYGIDRAKLVGDVRTGWTLEVPDDKAHP